LAGRVSHSLDDKQSFIETLQPLIPFDPQGLVALKYLSVASLRVVTTIAPLTDIVRQVSGQAIHLHGLVPQGVNSHTFQPAPSDVRKPLWSAQCLTLPLGLLPLQALLLVLP
jgi:hypothetical protein